MKFGLSFCLLIFNLFALGQTKTVYVPEAKWQIELPQLDSFSTGRVDSMMSRVEQTINATYDVSYDLTSNITTYFMVKGEGFNMFNCQVSAYDSSEHSSWDSSYLSTVILLKDIVKRQAPNIQLVDSKSSTLLIDSVTFREFTVETFYPQMDVTLNVIWLCANFEAYDLSLNISYTNEEWKDFCLELIAQSKFLE